MRPMRKLESENVTPEGQRSLDVRDGDTGVICRDDAKWHTPGNVQPVLRRKPSAWQALSCLAVRLPRRPKGERLTFQRPIQRKIMRRDRAHPSIRFICVIRG